MLGANFRFARSRDRAGRSRDRPALTCDRKIAQPISRSDPNLEIAQTFCAKTRCSPVPLNSGILVSSVRSDQSQGPGFHFQDSDRQSCSKSAFSIFKIILRCVASLEGSCRP